MPITIRVAVLAALALPLVSCGTTEKEAEPVVPVQVAPAIRGSIRRIVAADAIL